MRFIRAFAVKASSESLLLYTIIVLFAGTEELNAAHWTFGLPNLLPYMPNALMGKMNL